MPQFITDLKLYIDLAETLHFGHTSHRCHVTPPTLTRTIKRLEEMAKSLLFIRNNRHVSLTESGRRFLVYAQQVIDAHASVLETLSESSDGIIGELKIFCSVTATYSVLPAILAKFREEYPGINVSILTGDAEEAAEMVRSRQADVGITSIPLNPTAQLRWAKVGETPLTLVARDPSQSTPMPLLVPAHGDTRRMIDDWVSQDALSNLPVSVSGYEAILCLASVGYGMAIIPEIVLDNSRLRHQVTKIPTARSLPTINIGVCIDERLVKRPVLAAFIDTLPKFG